MPAENTLVNTPNLRIPSEIIRHCTTLTAALQPEGLPATHECESTTVHLESYPLTKPTKVQPQTAKNVDHVDVTVNSMPQPDTVAMIGKPITRSSTYSIDGILSATSEIRDVEISSTVTSAHGVWQKVTVSNPTTLRSQSPSSPRNDQLVKGEGSGVNCAIVKSAGFWTKLSRVSEEDVRSTCPQSTHCNNESFANCSIPPEIYGTPQPTQCLHLSNRVQGA
jgi:hypothetical protein